MKHTYGIHCMTCNGCPGHIEKFQEALKNHQLPKQLNMNNSIYIVIFLASAIVLSACQSNHEKTTEVEVKFSGALKTLMSGNIEPVMSLDSLSVKKQLYALGAAAHLKGEIQIFDSKPSNSFVLDSSLQIRDSYQQKASLLVYAEVAEWDSFQIEKNDIHNTLEDHIFKIASDNGINVEKPFPFLLEGKVASLYWHVINWKDGDSIHNHKKHKESGLNGRLKNSEVQIIGFYSTQHKAVFTHHTTNVHMHFKTLDNRLAGHIDDLDFSEALTLKLPKQ